MVAFHDCAHISSSCGEQGRSDCHVWASLQRLPLSRSAGSRLEGFGSLGTQAYCLVARGIVTGTLHWQAGS